MMSKLWASSLRPEGCSPISVGCGLPRRAMYSPSRGVAITPASSLMVSSPTTVTPSVTVPAVQPVRSPVSNPRLVAAAEAGRSLTPERMNGRAEAERTSSPSRRFRSLNTRAASPSVVLWIEAVQRAGVRSDLRSLNSASDAPRGRADQFRPWVCQSARV